MDYLLMHCSPRTAMEITTTQTARFEIFTGLTRTGNPTVW